MARESKRERVRETDRHTEGKRQRENAGFRDRQREREYVCERERADRYSSVEKLLYSDHLTDYYFQVVLVGSGEGGSAGRGTSY